MLWFLVGFGCLMGLGAFFLALYCLRNIMQMRQDFIAQLLNIVPPVTPDNHIHRVGGQVTMRVIRPEEENDKNN